VENTAEFSARAGLAINFRKKKEEREKERGKEKKIHAAANDALLPRVRASAWEFALSLPGR